MEARTGQGTDPPKRGGPPWAHGDPWDPPGGPWEGTWGPMGPPGGPGRALGDPWAPPGDPGGAQGPKKLLIFFPQHFVEGLLKFVGESVLSSGLEMTNNSSPRKTGQGL